MEGEEDGGGEEKGKGKIRLGIVQFSCNKKKLQINA
jgi:hypothetical protein